MSNAESPAILTVFRSRLRPGAEACGYFDVADDMEDRARAMPGFLEFKTFTADDGERVALATFEDIDSHDRWRENPEHRAAQSRGRADFYAEYRIVVAEVVRQYSFRMPNPVDGEA